jgi:hypothetical protein
MADHRVLTRITTALLSMSVLGCAGPAADIGVRLAGAGPSPASNAGLCGTWQGDFSYIGSDHQSSTGSSDLMLEVGGDSSYTLRWGNKSPEYREGHCSGESRLPPRRVGITDHSRSLGRHALWSDEGPGKRKADDDEPGKAGSGS